MKAENSVTAGISPRITFTTSNSRSQTSRAADSRVAMKANVAALWRVMVGTYNYEIACEWLDSSAGDNSFEDPGSEYAHRRGTEWVSMTSFHNSSSRSVAL